MNSQKRRKTYEELSQFFLNSVINRNNAQQYLILNDASLADETREMIEGFPVKVRNDMSTLNMLNKEVGGLSKLGLEFFRTKLLDYIEEFILPV